jgi:hypothetical protein
MDASDLGGIKRLLKGSTPQGFNSSRGKWEREKWERGKWERGESGKERNGKEGK